MVWVGCVLETVTLGAMLTVTTACKVALYDGLERVEPYRGSFTCRQAATSGCALTDSASLLATTKLASAP